MIRTFPVSILMITLLAGLNLNAAQITLKPALQGPRPAKLTKLQAQLRQARPGIPIEVKLRTHEKMRGLVK